MEKKPLQAKGKETTQNVNFVQVYQAGWARMDYLILDKPRSTLRVYIYLLSRMTKTGVVFATQTKIASDLGMSLSTVKRNLQYLEEVTKSIVTLKTPEAHNMYGINPREAWRSTESQKSRSVYEKRRASEHFPRIKKKPYDEIAKEIASSSNDSSDVPKNPTRTFVDSRIAKSSDKDQYDVAVEGSPF